MGTEYTPAGISSGYRVHFGEHLMPTTVDPQRLLDLLASPTPPRLLDVRTPAEFESAHIAGSYNVPLDLLKEHHDEIAGHLDREVVLVCRSGQRAGQADEILRTAGFSGVHVLDGGIMAWQAQGLAVNRGKARWDLERQVRLVAGSLVLSGVLASVAVPKLKWVAVGIGGGLTFAALTDTCAMGMALAKLPYNRGNACDGRTLVDRLTADCRSESGVAQPCSR
jgi:rhodanese-related sulfurtransferase